MEKSEFQINQHTIRDGVYLTHIRCIVTVSNVEISNVHGDTLTIYQHSSKFLIDAQLPELKDFIETVALSFKL